MKFTKTKEYESNGTKYLLEVEFNLSETGNNGHADFSQSGALYRRIGRGKREIAGGQIDEIEIHFPEFSDLRKMHMSDQNGVPMFHITNSDYWTSKGSLSEALENLRVSREELDDLSRFYEDPKVYSTRLIDLGIIDRWKAEADKAIAIMERETGETFKSKATRGHFIALSKDEQDKARELIASDYFDPDMIKKRKEEKEREAREVKIESLSMEYHKKVKSLRQELKIMATLLENGFSDDNVIFYKHSEEVAFNWKGKSDYDKIWTREEFKRAVEALKEDDDLALLKYKLK